MSKDKTFPRQCLDTIRFGNRSGSHEGCLRISTSNTYEHEFRKFQVFYELRKRGFWVLSECIFENGSRADILDASNGIIYEVLHTETEKEADEKFAKYPTCFQIRYVKTSDPWRPELLD